MISVVICSVNKALAAQVKRNIDTTIGVPWQLVLLDNSVLKKSISEVYNLGAAQAQHSIICFVHEDVLFKTQDWGKKIASYFAEDPELGLLGVAGARYKSKTFSGWATGIQSFDCCNIFHTDPAGKVQHIYLNPDPSTTLQQTVTLDGVFICARQSVWKSSPFNEKFLKGFHLYDIDFSFAIARKHKVAVTYEIDIDHLTTGGDYGNAWLDYTIRWHLANAHLLPVSVQSQGDRHNVETTIAKNWLNRLKSEPISLKNRIRWLTLSKAAKRILLWPHILLFLVFRTIRKKK